MPVPTWASLRTRSPSGFSSFARKPSTIWIIESPVATTVLACAGAANARRPTATAAARRFTSQKLAGGGGHHRGFGPPSDPRAHDDLAGAGRHHHHAAHARGLARLPDRRQLHPREDLPQHHLHLERGERRPDA